VPEVNQLTIEERFTRDLARRQAIIATLYAGGEDAYVNHFFAELNVAYNPPAVLAERSKVPRPSLTERQARRAARKAKRYAGPGAFPSFKKEPITWKFRKADRVIYHQVATSTAHDCACAAKATRFMAGNFDSKVWMCAGCFATKEKATLGTAGKLLRRRFREAITNLDAVGARATDRLRRHGQMSASSAQVPSVRSSMSNHHLKSAAFDAIGAAANGRSWVAGLF
jgi:hypothetical protein